ncbi:MAG: DUF362 domain-containing protein [Opitutales bacterium]
MFHRFTRTAGLCLSLLATLPAGLWAQSDDATVGRPQVLWEYPLSDFSQDDYIRGVEELIQRYEETSGELLVPGDKGRVGLKVYTHSGLGMSTSKELVRAVAAAMLRRGYTRDDIWIVDEGEFQLRQSGFLPPLTQGGWRFEGMPVLALDTRQYYDDRWYYDSPLASRAPRLARRLSDGRLTEPDDMTDEERRSYLPVPLLLEVDFWINLPVFLNAPALGVSGALANATVWNVDNAQRFLSSSATGPIAVAEMAAIPELQESWIFSIASLEYYQFAGGPVFNANYSGTADALWLSSNPVLMDYLMYLRINRHRENRGLPLIQPVPPMLAYCRSLGIGDERLDETKRIRLERR